MQDEGIFLWVDGSPLNFTNWSGTEITSLSGNEDCVYMRRRNGTWRVVNCTFNREFLCRESKPFSFSFVWLYHALDVRVACHNALSANSFCSKPIPEWQSRIGLRGSFNERSDTVYTTVFGIDFFARIFGRMRS